MLSGSRKDLSIVNLQRPFGTLSLGVSSGPFDWLISYSLLLGDVNVLPSDSWDSCKWDWRNQRKVQHEKDNRIPRDLHLPFLCLAFMLIVY